MQMFIAAVLVTAGNWRQSHHPSISEWINTSFIWIDMLWCIYAVEYYLAIKRKTIDTCHDMNESQNF